MSDRPLADLRCIVLHTPGKAIRLSSEARWRQAVDAADLTPERMVTLEWRDGATEHVRAGDVPALRTLFPDGGEPGGEPPVPLAPPEPVEPPPAAEPPSTAVPRYPQTLPLGGWLRRAEPSPPPPPPAPEPVRAPEPAPEPPPRREPPRAAPTRPARPPRKRSGCFWPTMILLALVSGFLVWNRDRGGSPEGSTLYVARPTRVRTEPSTAGNTPVATLPRGAPVRGEDVEGSDGSEGRWLRITEGEHEGDYVYVLNLRKTAPPQLDTVIDRRLTSPGGVVLRTGPAIEYDRAGEIAAGASAQVAGRLRNGWYEVLPSRGGVAYAPPDGFE